MKFKSPFVTRKTYNLDVQLHDKEVRRVREQYEDLIPKMRTEYQRQVDAEYARALLAGKMQLHRVAVDMTYDIFMNGTDATTPAKWQAFLFDLEGMFSPGKMSLPDETTNIGRIS